MSIQPLPPHVIAQIKSSIAITSLNGVVFELFKNSLDAGATRVDISVDYSRGGCVIEDDGLGILPSEFAESGGLGKLHHTSKLHANSPTHGSRGSFLASLAALSFISITSHHHLHHSHNSLSMHKSSYVTRQIPTPPLQYLTCSNHGTRVLVRDLFGSMPVRVKQRPPTSDVQFGKSNIWHELKRGLVAMLLCWPNDVSIMVRESGTTHKFSIRPNITTPVAAAPNVTDVAKASSILTQVSYITTGEIPSWVRISASTSSLSITGAISLVPNANKHVQFLAFGPHALLPMEGQSMFYDEINHIFTNSAFGYEDESAELDEYERDRRAKDGRYKGNGYTNKELRGGRKGVDRWPMFYINIQPISSAKTSHDLDDILGGKGKSLSAITNLLQAVIFEFLKKNHFQPRASQGRPSEKIKQTRREALIQVNPGVEPVLRSQSTPAVSPTDDSAVTESSVARKRPRRSISVQPNLKRHLSNLDSPFHGWSRVKSGATSSKFGNSASNNHSCEVIGEIDESATGSLRNRDELGIDVLTSTKGLVSKSGKLVKRPFTEVQNRQEKVKKSTDDSGSKDEDKTVLWTNPITRVTSLVDLRSGRVLPASESTAPKRISTRLAGSSSLKAGQNSSWINDLLKDWDNPVYKPAELPIPQAVLDEGPISDIQKPQGRRHYHHCSHFDANTATNKPQVFDQRISKESLQKSEVISQVDKKFILVNVPLPMAGESGNDSLDTLLVIIDQHAADERVRIEALMEDLCNKAATGEAATHLDKPISFDISSKETPLLRKLQSHFAKWGIRYELPENPTPGNSEKVQKMTVRGLPSGIAERCRLDPKLLIDLVRTEAWAREEKGIKHLSTSPPSIGDSKHAWLQNIHDCPRGIIELLNSRACRSAIMFNDELSNDACKTLVQRLAACAFPFQCAHGRPSMIPLVNLGKLGGDPSGSEGEGEMITKERSFGASFNRWKRGV